MFTVKWRLVCHACGSKYPDGTAINIHQARCCQKPVLHVHTMEPSCKKCA